MKRIMMIIIAVSILIAGCKNDGNNEEIKKRIPVTLTQVKLENVKIPIRSSGKISSQKEMKLSFKTGGIINRILVDEGEIVRRGEMLAELDLQEINSEVLKARSALEKSERDYKRVDALFQDSVITLEQFQNMKTALEISTANYKIAKFNQEHSTIIAPSNGQIFKKLAETNEITAPGNPIFIFGSISDNWKITTGITDKDINKIELGDSASISIDAIPNNNFPAVVSEIAGSLNPYSSTFEVELSFSKSNPDIFSGMLGTVEIYPSSSQNLKTIPINALVNAERMHGEVFTVVINDSSAKRVKVQIGDIFEEKVSITEGLDDIENVVVGGVEYLYDGAKVKIVGNKEVK